MVGLCAQDAHIFDSTIRENLRLARPECDDDDLRDVLRRVRLLEWVDRLPDGLGDPPRRGWASTVRGRTSSAFPLRGRCWRIFQRSSSTNPPPISTSPPPTRCARPPRGYGRPRDRAHHPSALRTRTRRRDHRPRGRCRKGAGQARAVGECRRPLRAGMGIRALAFCVLTPASPGTRGRALVDVNA